MQMSGAKMHGHSFIELACVSQPSLHESLRGKRAGEDVAFDAADDASHKESG